MTRGTVIVEAAIRSGALNTAGWTLDIQKRKIDPPLRAPATPEAVLEAIEAVTCRPAL